MSSTAESHVLSCLGRSGRFLFRGFNARPGRTCPTVALFKLRGSGTSTPLPANPFDDQNANVNGPKTDPKLPGPKARASWDQFLIHSRWLSGPSRPRPVQSRPLVIKEVGVVVSSLKFGSPLGATQPFEKLFKTN